jgi:sorbitol-6-phosphate 2-dehydrogenase
MSWLGLKGKRVIVTGGASGIGKTVSEHFAKEGADVIIADVSEESGKQVAEDLEKKHGSKQLFVKTDVTSKDSVDNMVKEAIERFGGVDVLVNNAGINIPRLLVDPDGKEELTPEIWDKVVAVNQKGVFLCSQAVVREMIKSGNGGVIINMASATGKEGSEGQSVYAGTKAAVYTLTISWAKELGKHNIRVCGVAPDVIEATALRSDEYERSLAYTRDISVEELRKGYVSKRIPLRRVGKIEEVADTICFLASDRAGYINGTVINISGGKSRT